MEWKMKIPEMELLLSVIHGHGLLAAFIFLLVNLSPSSSLSQGNGLPRMTSNIKEVLGKSFDYIIVGGGTAGCPLAATLSEKFSVLLIERGGSPYENPMVLDKKYFGFPFLQTDDFSSVAQRFISEDGVPNLRGRVLGGTSTINAGFYSRASADFIKRVGWDEKLVKEAYEWVESKIVFKPLLTKWSSAVKSALLEAGILPFNGFSWDHIAGTKIGGTVFDADRKRHISADLLERGNSSNIVVLLNATVKNIVFRRDGNKSVVRGVRFIKSNGSINQTYEAYLSQPPENSSQQGDVILSAGALGSPQILLLSGIGPRAHLQNFSIPLFLDLKGVGQDMQDNPGIPLILRAKPEHRLPEPPQVVGIAKDFKFIVEGFVLPVGFNATTLMRVSIKLAFPESKGKLELNSTDPRQNPVVLFNYLAEEKDLRECVQMVQLVKKVARSRSIARFLGTKPRINVTSNPNELRNFCRKNVRTYYHFHGGCSIGSVIDRDYRVIGVKGLRVLDGSTLPESPGTNPMATLLMLGRYQGIKILEERENASAFGNQQHP